MTEQLTLDFTASATQRHRRAKKLAEIEEQPTLFASWAPNIDIHLHSPAEAIAQIAGPDPERAQHWLAALVGSTRPLKTRRVAFSTDKLDRLLYVRPPAQITLDAAAAAVGRALWATKLGFKPLNVRRERQRLLADSPRWPRGFRVKDAPWTAIATIVHLGLPLNVAEDAKRLLRRKLEEAGAKVAVAGLAGSAVVIETTRPEIVENMGLPGLAYAGEPRTGSYKIPLLSAEPLLNQQVIDIPGELRTAIEKATAPVRPLRPKDLGPDFPWTLYGFQADDAARAVRILETTGGVLLAGDMGSGKSLDTSTILLAPSGPIRAGDVRVGDDLVGLDGKPTRVLGVYPQGERPLYRVTFTDGRSILADPEHLWSVHSPVQKKRGRPGKVLTTQQLLDGGLRDGAGNLRWYIPMCEPVQFEPPAALPVDPYLLGVLLGDGGLSSSSICITTDDRFIADEVQRLLPEGGELVLAPLGDNARLARAEERGCDPAEIRDQSYRVRGAPGLRQSLRALDLLGKRAWEKSVPQAYLYAPEPDRRALLQGLLDTDGGLACAGRSPSSIEFTSTSEQLVDDVRWLVESLGGTGRKSAPRRTGYSYKGEKHWGRPSWRLTIALPNGVKPFRLPKKADRYVERVKYQPTRGVKSIEPAGAGEAVCFMVDAADHLFLGDGAVALHNTTVSLGLAQNLDIWPLLVVAPLSAFSTWDRQLNEMGRKSYLAVESPRKSWEAIEHGEFEAVVISFDRLPAFVELIERMPFRGIIADEIQRIRTPGSKRSRALRALAASVPLRIGLSGTPLTNTVNDLLPLGAFLAPGEWRPRANDKDLEDMYPGDPVEGVAEHLGSLMVRRRIDEVGKQMPKRNDRRVYVNLTAEQRAAIAALEQEAEEAKESGEFDGPRGKFNALVKLGKMRSLIANPGAAGVAGRNPKIDAAVTLIKDFHAAGRKGVVFTVDRASYIDLGAELDKAGIRWGGIWGATPPMERIAVEKRLHAGELDVVIGTLQAAGESWSASPTCSYSAFLSYAWAPSILAQAEARVYRLNSDVKGPPIEIVYLHATAPGGSLDDRMVEILERKKSLFAQVVDRRAYVDTTEVHVQLSDLVYALTGKKDERLEAREKDAQAAADAEQARKKHAQNTLYKSKGRNKTRADIGLDDGSQAITLEQYHADLDAFDVEDLVAQLDVDEDGDVTFDDDEQFDIEDDED